MKARAKDYKEQALLRVRDLCKIYGNSCDQCITLTGPDMGSNICPKCRSIVACAEISFDINYGEIVGVVGESGSGKSTLIKLLHFDQSPFSGRAYLNSYENARTDLLNLSDQKKRWIRNHQFGIVYQNPFYGLRMNFSCGGNIAEKLIAADWYHYGNIRGRATELLLQTELPLSRIDDLPKYFSGGMQQRVQIAKALANNPPILLLDEVTTGLDVSVQAQILNLIRHIQHSLKISMLLVSHDFAVIRMLAQRTIVMKNGRIVEGGLTDQIMEDPQHPYTQLLINSML